MGYIVDECSKPHDCGHNCTNTFGGYTCSCRQGFMLHNDNATCNGEELCMIVRRST